ncbi:MAG: helix-turn-helix domain-containing protein [Candidatus Scatosoma sp.]
MQKYYRHKIENLLVIRKIVTIHYFEFDKNFRSKGESHDFWELVYADKGNVVCRAEENEILLNEGEMLFHKPNEFHSLAADGRTPPNVFIISFECKSEAIRFFENKRLPLQKKFLKYIYEIIKESKKTFDLPYSNPDLKKMIVLEKPTLGGKQLIKNLLELLLINVMRSETEKENTNGIFLQRPDVDGRVSQKIIRFLKNNIGRKITVDDICDALMYNKSYLFRQFKADVGEPIIVYFTKLKIERAKELLRDKSITVSQIAETLSFDSPNYFSKTFKKYTYMTPSQYRKIHDSSPGKD